MFGTLPEEPFVDVARMIGGALLVGLFVRYWWTAREGGPAAVRNAGIVLALAAVLSPATLPWYLSWGFCLLAMIAWSARGLQWMVLGSVWLMVAYYPTGETALYNWGFLAVAVAGGALASVSLLRPDPLRLRMPRRAAVPLPVEPRLVAPEPGRHGRGVRRRSRARDRRCGPPAELSGRSSTPQVSRTPSCARTT